MNSIIHNGNGWCKKFNSHIIKRFYGGFYCRLGKIFIVPQNICCFINQKIGLYYINFIKLVLFFDGKGFFCSLFVNKPFKNYGSIKDILRGA